MEDGGDQQVAWFEFLLDDELLLNHLRQENPIPSPNTLLTTFLINTDKWPAGELPPEGEEETLESKSRRKKSQSLKLMALQTAAFLHWDLDNLATLPLVVQQMLMKHAIEMLEENEFLGSLYHRWVLRSSQAHLKSNFVSDPAADAVIRSLAPETSLEYLDGLIASKSNPGETVIIPTPLTFSARTTDFSVGEKITVHAFLSMIHLDMGVHLLYKGDTPTAVQHFKSQKLPMKNFPFFQIAEKKLTGYLTAVGIILDPRTMEEDRTQAKIEETARLLRTSQLGKLKKNLNLDMECITWERGLASTHADKHSPEEDLVTLQTRLLETSAPVEVKNLLLKLNAICGGGRTFSKLFTSWDLPIPIQHAILKIPGSPFQDYVYILIAKSKQFLNMRLFQDSRNWLHATMGELNEQIKSSQAGPTVTSYLYNLSKLSKMLEWEILLVDVSEYMEEWPKQSSELVAARCKECLRCFQSQSSELIPRTEIVENILIGLINMEEYQFVAGFENGQQKWPFLEFLVLLATVCIDLCEKKDSASSYRDMWHAVIPVFSSFAPVKRQTNKAGMIPSRSVFMWVVERSRSHTLMTIFTSLLARLHNHIMDEVGFQIHTDFIHIWPNILDDISATSSEAKANRSAGSSKLNARHIRDVLLQLLKRPIAGEVYWLKCTGDVYLASGNPSLAMKAYLEYLAITTEFFEKHSVENWKDEGLLRRMIKCCEIMQAYTQAVILCQFLPEVDYSLAFGMAQEKLTTDSSDALYGFIWDLTILEFLVTLHTKRNEVGKRLQAIRVMGLLELNANNNDEIQREAMHLRQSQFMRTLAKLYIFV